MSAGGPRPRACLEGLRPYQPGKPAETVRREHGLARVVKLASNENPYGCSPGARRAAAAALRQAHIYPDGSSPDLRRALAGALRCPPEAVMLGAGSNELLLLLGQGYAGPGDEVLTAEMSFTVYETVARLADARLVTVPLRDHAYPLESMARAITAKTRIVFVANPNNPTGTAVHPEALRRFLDRVPARCLVVLDEAYHEYMESRYRTPSLRWVRERCNLVVLRTFSKAYGLAGLRIGYGVAPPAVAAVVEKVRAPFNLTRPAQAAAEAALADPDYMHQAVARVTAERKRLDQGLRGLGFATTPSQANFIFCRVPVADAAVWFERLQRFGYIVRPCGARHLRITVGTPSQNGGLLRALRRVGRSFSQD